MTLDLLFTVFLLAAGIFGYINIGSVDNSTASELGAAFWPRLILVLLLILVVIDLVSIIKNKNGKGALNGATVAEFFKSKLFLGMVICVVTAVILPMIGFIPTCAIFLVAYGVLLGEKRPAILAITAVVATLILYFIFQGPLGIYLPRGNGAFRQFALAMESVLSAVGF